MATHSEDCISLSAAGRIFSARLLKKILQAVNPFPGESIRSFSVRRLIIPAAAESCLSLLRHIYAAKQASLQKRPLIRSAGQ